MCGIAGYMTLDGSPCDISRLKAMSDVIRHRGPDGQGQWTEGPIGLSHRRLAVLDLTNYAAQPMISANERFVIAFNGEIYNFREIKRELEERGVIFRSTGDTEVLLEAFAEWGEALIGRLNGMFAFVCWDRKTKKLHLVRDRYGVKPLYIARSGTTVLFGSEIKALLAQGDLIPEVNLEGLAEYLTFQNFFTNHTLFKNVELIPAGHFMTIDLEGSEAVSRYWDFRFRDEDTRTTEELIEDLDTRFRAAVNSQLVSDVAVGSYLSGGMDTGSISAIAAQSQPQMCSFTVGFDLHSASGLELGYDERAAAERLSYINKTEHYEMVLKAGDMERCMSDLVWHIEEPRVGQSYPNYYAAKLASKFGKVVLSGVGGDELFAGYPWRYYRSVKSTSFDHYIDDYYHFWQRLLKGKTFQKVTAPIQSEISGLDRKELFRSVFLNSPEKLDSSEDYVNHSLYFEAKTFMHGILVVEDKLSMAHGLETRVPFLDNALVDLAMRIPVHKKLRAHSDIVNLDENAPGSKQANYFARSNDGKIIMRQLMRKYVPSDISEGLKQGFSGPDSSWFRGESIEYVKRTLNSKNARLWDLLDRKETLELVQGHLSGSSNRRLLIWSLLYLEEFLGQFMGDGLKSRLANAGQHEN